MKLSLTGWKRVVCFYLAVVMAFMATESSCFAAKASVKYDDRIYNSKVTEIVCAANSITIHASIWISSEEVEAAGAEIYRAEIKANGKRGSFKRIKVCKNLEQDKYIKQKWDLTYKDSTVKTGQAYVYKCRGFIKTGNVKKFQKEYIKTRKGVAANAVGEYMCKVVKNTSNKLTIKVTGKNKDNGLLECNIGDELSRSAWLVYKDAGTSEIVKSLTPEAYSYNGKKWYSKSSFKIQGKKSVYLRFSGKDMNVSGYQYVQMIVEHMRYNLCPQSDSDMTELCLNLTSGETSADDFIIAPTRLREGKTKWDGDIFQTNIFTAKYDVKYDNKLGYSHISVGCTLKSITVNGSISADAKPTGAEIYRAKIKANGKRGNFEKIGVCEKLKQDTNNKQLWNFTYKDNTVKARQAYVYKCRGFRKTGNVTKIQEGSSDSRKGVAAKKVGKYTCKVVQNKSNNLVIKVTGKSKNNGPLECFVNSNSYSCRADLVCKNKGKKTVPARLTLKAYSYDGKKWYYKNKFTIKGKESVYLRFSDLFIENTNISDYQYVQILTHYMRYNLCRWSRFSQEMPQMRLNLTSGEASVGNFVKLNLDTHKYITEWDGGIFKYNVDVTED